MSIFKKIGNWLLETAKKFSFRDWVIFALVLISARFIISSYYYRHQASEPKYVYVTDSIESYKNKLKEEYSAKQIVIAERDELKKINAELYSEVKNLKDNPLVVTKTKVVFKTDTILAMSDSITAPDIMTKNLFWSASDRDFYVINGVTSVKSDFSSFQTSVNNLCIPITITTDIVEKDKQLMFITKSDNPYVDITYMNGAFLNPSDSKVIKSHFPKKRWGIGLQLGAGVDKNLGITPYLGIGASYNLIVF